MHCSVTEVPVPKEESDECMLSRNEDKLYFMQIYFAESGEI
jgi:hypothetical protein